MDFTALTNIDMALMSFLNGSDSLFADRLMMFFTSGLTWVPMYVMLLFCVVHNNKSVRQMTLVVGMALLMVGMIDLVISNLIKPEFMRFRPAHDPVYGSAISVVDGYRGGRYGFFSAHAANTFSIALYFSLVMRSGYLTATLMLWSMLNCYTRMYLGVHYPSDIFCGLLFGTLMAVGAYRAYAYIYNKVSGPMSHISAQFTSTGYAHTDVYMVIIVFYATLLVGTLNAVLVL